MAHSNSEKSQNQEVSNDQMERADRKNSRRFLDAYAGIEKVLRDKVGWDRSHSFYRLVEAASKTDRSVRSFAVELKEYGDLRNAIVHERIGGEPIAEPHSDTAERLEEIHGILIDPPRVDANFLGDVATSEPKDPIGAAAHLMLEGSFSQVPIYSPEGEFVGLLTAATIARWLATRLESGLGMLEEEPVESVLECTEDQENHAFVGRGDTLFTVLDLFAKFERRGKSLDAILVTHSGRRDQKPMGILTVFDLPKVYEEVGLRGVS